MTKKELLKALVHVPDDTAINLAMISWGELDVDSPDELNMYHFVDQNLIKNLPQKDIDLNDLMKKE